MRSLLSAFLTLLVVPCMTCNARGVTLVESGRPAAIIVTADEPSPAVRQAAEDLQLWLRRCSGANLSIHAERELSGGASGRTWILIGDTDETRGLGIDSSDFGLEEFVVRSFPDRLVIVGDDERPDGQPLHGTVLAVHAFAEEILGVRMLWPGDLGEIVPFRPTIAVNDIDLRQQPVLVNRVMDNHGFNGVTHSKLDALGWDRDKFREFQSRNRLWFRFHRFGGSFQASAGHAFGHYWERFHEEHPDWFAQQPDGTRDNAQPDHGGYPAHRLCVSNPGLIEQVAQDCIEKLRRSPTLDAVSVTPNDGGKQTFCLCDRCESWDFPNAPMVTMRSKQGPLEHVSFSDRYVRFYSEIAERVARELPNRNIGALAYAVYTHAPQQHRLHPNVVIGFVPGTKVYLNEAKRQELRDHWLKWSQKADRMFIRPNFLLALHGLPTVFVHRLGEDMRFYADHNMLYAEFDCNCGHWSTNGLNYYVQAKLTWDPHADVDAIVDDYCRAGFGPAAAKIREYFNRVEQITTEVALENRRPEADVVARHYTDEAIADLNSLLGAAEQQAGYDELIRQRVQFLRQGLDYAPVCRDYLVAKADSGLSKWKWREYTEQTVRRANWFQQLGPSWAIHAPWLIYWDW